MKLKLGIIAKISIIAMKYAPEIGHVKDILAKVGHHRHEIKINITPKDGPRSEGLNV